MKSLPPPSMLIGDLPSFPSLAKGKRWRSLKAFGNQLDKKNQPVIRNPGYVLALNNGTVTGDIQEVESGRENVAAFLVSLSNDSAEAVGSVTSYTKEDAGGGGPVNHTAIMVEPFSAASYIVEVPHNKRHLPRIDSQIYTFGDADLTMHATATYKRKFDRRFLAAPILIALIVIGEMISTSMNPHIFALAAPENAVGSTPFSVAYETSDNTSSSTYSVEAMDGSVLSGGRLLRASGGFTVVLPKTTRPEKYDIHLRVKNKFGIDERTNRILSLPAPIIAVVKPKMLLWNAKLDSNIVNGGGSALVSYQANATSGSVRLLDQQGSVRAEAILSAQGSSMLAIPYVDTDQDFRISIEARNGKDVAQSDLPIRILHTVRPATKYVDPTMGSNDVYPVLPNGNFPADTRVPNLTLGSAPVQGYTPFSDGSNQRNLKSNQGISKIENVINLPPMRGNQRFSVRPIQFLDQPVLVEVQPGHGLKLSIYSSSSGEVASVDPLPTEKVVSISLPPNSQTGRYSVVATFDRGQGQETEIQRFILRAH